MLVLFYEEEYDKLLKEAIMLELFMQYVKDISWSDSGRVFITGVILCALGVFIGNVAASLGRFADVTIKIFNKRQNVVYFIGSSVFWTGCTILLISVFMVVYVLLGWAFY